MRHAYETTIGDGVSEVVGRGPTPEASHEAAQAEWDLAQLCDFSSPCIPEANGRGVSMASCRVTLAASVLGAREIGYWTTSDLIFDQALSPERICALFR